MHEFHDSFGPISSLGEVQTAVRTTSICTFLCSREGRELISIQYHFSVSALTLSNVTGGSNQISISTLMNRFIRELLSPCKQTLLYRLPKNFWLYVIHCDSEQFSGSPNYSSCVLTVLWFSARVLPSSVSSPLYTYFTNYDLSQTSSRARHTLSSQPYRRKVPFVQRDLRYGDCGSHHMLRTEPSNMLTMTNPKRRFRQLTTSPWYPAC